MHEFSIAQGILETALTEAEKNNGKRICALRVKLGRASHIEPNSLEFCLRAVAKGTIAENARVEIKSSEPGIYLLRSSGNGSFLVPAILKLESLKPGLPESAIIDSPCLQCLGFHLLLRCNASWRLNRVNLS